MHKSVANPATVPVTNKLIGLNELIGFSVQKFVCKRPRHNIPLAVTNDIPGYMRMKFRIVGSAIFLQIDRLPSYEKHATMPVKIDCNEFELLILVILLLCI
jgi:hypothetical protein